MEKNKNQGVIYLEKKNKIVKKNYKNNELNKNIIRMSWYLHNLEL